MSTLIRAIKITLDEPHADMPDIGLYGNELRYCESPLTGVADAYTPGLLIDSGNPSYTIDCRTGGGSVQARDVSVVLAGVVEINGSPYPIEAAFDLYGVKIRGRKIQIIEFEGTETDSDAVEIYTMYTGFIESATVTSETEYTLTARTSLSLKRNANMSTVIDGIVAPIIYGSSDPLVGRYFKLPRSKSTDELQTLLDLSAPMTGSNMHPKTEVLFPVYENSTLSNQIKIRLCKQRLSALQTIDPDNFIGKYIVIKEGEGEIVGSYRKITNIVFHELYDYGAGVDIFIEMGATLFLQDYLPKNVIGNYGATADNNTWLSIYDVEMIFQMDLLPGLLFYDSKTGVALNRKTEVYGKDSNQVVRPLLTYGCDVNVSGDSLEVNPRFFDGDVNGVSSMHVIPCAGVEPLETDNDTLDVFGISDIYEQVYSAGSKVLGWFSSDGSAIGTTADSGGDYSHDRNSTTFYQYSASFAGNVIAQFLAFRVALPEIPEKLKFSAVYLGVRLTCETAVNGVGITESRFVVARRGYINRVHECINRSTVNFNNHSVLIDNIPDFHYIDSVSTGNKNFYMNDNLPQLQTGYKLIDLAISSREEYENIEEIAMLFYMYGGMTSMSCNIRMYEIGFIFENNINISSEVYV